MKKILLFALSVFLLASCSDGSGSKEIQIDEVTVLNYRDLEVGDESKDVSSWFSVVPGKYELKWDYKYEQFGIKKYDAHMKIKLRLNNTVEVSPDVLSGKTDGVSSAIFNIPFMFSFVDENGQDIKFASSALLFTLCTKLFEDNGQMASDYSNMDEYAEFMKFLQSSPGTEAEFEIRSSVSDQSDVPDCNTHEYIQKAKGLKMKIISHDSVLADKYKLK